MKKKRDAFQAQYSWQRTNDAAVLDRCVLDAAHQRERARDQR